MQVIINGRPRRAPAKMTLAQAVALLTSAPTGVAAALNGDCRTARSLGLDVTG